MNNPTPSPIYDNEPHRRENPTGSNPEKIYIPPQGPGINDQFFTTDRSERTQLFMMIPTVKATPRTGRLRYPNHVKAMHDTIDAHIGKKLAFTEVKYSALDPDGPDGNLMWEDLRGTALFQYDPDSDGNGKRAWRMWLEERFYTGRAA